MGIGRKSRNKPFIDCLLILLRRSIILQRENKREITLVEIEQLTKQQMKQELYIARKQHKVDKFKKRWPNRLREELSVLCDAQSNV